MNCCDSKVSIDIAKSTTPEKENWPISACCPAGLQSQLIYQLSQQMYDLEISESVNEIKTFVPLNQLVSLWMRLGSS